MTPTVDVTPELYIYYYDNGKVWTDEDGKDIDIYQFLTPADIRIFLFYKKDCSFPIIFFGEDLILNVSYFGEKE